MLDAVSLAFPVVDFVIFLFKSVIFKENLIFQLFDLVAKLFAFLVCFHFL